MSSLCKVPILFLALRPLVGQTIPLHKIEHLIMIEIGTTANVIQETTRFMIDLGMIVERDHMIFEVIKLHV